MGVIVQNKVWHVFYGSRCTSRNIANSIKHTVHISFSRFTTTRCCNWQHKQNNRSEFTKLHNSLFLFFFVHNKIYRGKKSKLINKEVNN